MHYKNSRLVVFFSFFLIFLISCSDSSGPGDNNPPPQAQKVALSGLILSNTQAVADVTVSAGGKTTQSDANGRYSLTDVSVPSNKKLVVGFEKSGYSENFEVLQVDEQIDYVLGAELQSTERQSIDPSIINSVTIPNTTGGQADLITIDFPANSVTANGMVSVDVVVGDPTTDEGKAIFPGEYVGTGAGADVDLESISFTYVKLTDEMTGADISQLSEPATVTIIIPAALQSQYQAGDTIPWWSLDETTGLWVREDADPSTAALDDAAVIDVNGTLYAQAKASHFSWWNVDKPIEQHTCLGVTVVDDENLPLVGARVYSEGVTYGGSTYAVTDASGVAYIRVKRSQNNVTESVKLFVDDKGARFFYNVTDAAEGDIDLETIDTPTQQLTTIPQDCTMLNNSIVVGYLGEINGTIVYENTTTPVVGHTIYSSYGETTVTDVSGNFTLKAPIGIPVYVIIPGIELQLVTVPGAQTPVTLNLQLANQAPEIQNITRSVQGVLAPGGSLNLTVAANDPDSDPIDYEWTANGGSFNNTTATTVTWTAPAQVGDYTVTVKVTDDKGAFSTQNAVISVQDNNPQTGTITLTFYDNPIDKQLVAGVVYAFYAADNKTIAASGTTDTSGVASFDGGQRTNVSLTFGSTAPRSDAMIQRRIESFLDVPVGTYDIYLDQEAYLSNDCTTGDQITVNVNNSPNNFPVIQPFSLAVTDFSATQYDVCNIKKHSDGTVSFLAWAQQNSSGNVTDVVSLLDQNIVIDDTYTLNLAASTATLSWQTSFDTNALTYDIDMSAIRKNTLYYLGGGGVTPTGATGMASIAADGYLVNHEWTDNLGNSVRRQVFNTQQPSVANVALPDLAVDFAYDDVAKEFTIAKAGTHPDIDAVEVSVSDNTIQWEWTILATYRTTVTLMDLPSPLDTWVNLAGGAGGEIFPTAEVTIIDGSATNDTVNVLSISNNENPAFLFETAGEIVEATRDSILLLPRL